MQFLDFKRIFRSGFLNFLRTPFVSLASVMVMTITLMVITSLIFLQAILQFSLTEIQNKVDVTVYFVPGASESVILDLEGKIAVLPEVADTSYISADEALVEFKERHADDYVTLQALSELGENPLGASLRVKAKDPAQYESISRFLEEGSLSPVESNIIDKINYGQNKLVIDRLISLSDSAKRLGLIVTIILIAISVIITFNTLRLTIYIVRDEIAVMRLVGAENHYIHGPFIVEGIMYGIIATLVTLIIFIPITLWLGNSLESFFGINLFTYYVSNFFQILFINILVGSALGAFSSFLAIRKYLRV
jgi:cell division transport system permease protein